MKKIAVPIMNEMLFEHFGKSTKFKIYDIENGEIKSSKTIATLSVGHDALSSLMKTFSVDVVLCGHIGEGAKSRLAQNGVEAFSGFSGKADEVVLNYIKNL